MSAKLLCVAMTVIILSAHPVRSEEEYETPSLANQCGRTHKASVTPVLGTHQKASYPTLSVRLGEQGRTWMRVIIGKDGVAQSATVIFTSRSKRLDEAAVKSIVGKWRWLPPPPECADMGVPVAIMQDFSINKEPKPFTFGIFLDNPNYPLNARELRRGGSGELLITFSATGETTKVETMLSTNSEELDAKMIEVGSKLKRRPENSAESAPVQDRVGFEFIPHNNPMSILGLMGPEEIP